MSKNRAFTSQWSDTNFKIEYSVRVIFNYFMFIFFKKWIHSKPKNSSFEIKIEFGNKTAKDNSNSLFNYTRNIKNNKITTKLTNVKIMRAMVRSLYKFLNNKAVVVGVPELYMAIIRRTVIEPIEYFLHTQGWLLIHASVFRYDGKLFVVTAGSKAGKSTLVSKLLKYKDCEILADNYCFIKGDMVKTIEEPFRGGRISRFKLSLYGRTINGHPKHFEGKMNYFLTLNRGIKNNLKRIPFNEINLNICKTNSNEKEGIRFLHESDCIKIDKPNQLKEGNFETYKIEIAEGLENINIIIKLILNLK